jgi:hypothetical protein
VGQHRAGQTIVPLEDGGDDDLADVAAGVLGEVPRRVAGPTGRDASTWGWYNWWGWGWSSPYYYSYWYPTFYWGGSYWQYQYYTSWWSWGYRYYYYNWWW